MNTDTENLVKAPITELLRDGHLHNFLIQADDEPHREYPLRAKGITFRADFASELRQGGWLFVEDDDAQRAASRGPAEDIRPPHPWDKSDKGQANEDDGAKQDAPFMLAHEVRHSPKTSRKLNEGRKKPSRRQSPNNPG